MEQLYSKITQRSLDLFDAMLLKAHRATTPYLTANVIEEYIGYDEGVKQLLRLVYDPLIKYNIKIDPLLYEYFAEDVIETTGDVSKLLGILVELHTKGKNISAKSKREMVEWYIDTHSPHIIYFLRKTLDCGFAIGGAKKLGIVPQHSPQKGVLLKNPSKLVYPCIADFKYNGSRLTTIIKPDGSVECRLLKGQVIDIPLLYRQIESLGLKDCVLDGELVKVNKGVCAGVSIVGGITEADRIWVSGKITSATSMKQPLAMDGMVYVVYDYLPFADTMDKATQVTVGYAQRREYLAQLFDHPLMNSSVMSLGSMWLVNNEDELNVLTKAVKGFGSEGLMVKGMHSTYDHKKNNQWYKVKNIKECDLTIVDYVAHTKKVGWIGSLVCEGYVDGKKVVVSVGSGLNDADRPVEKFSLYKGRVVMVTYMDLVSREGSDIWSLTNPRFYKDSPARSLLEILRLDGNNVNY